LINRRDLLASVGLASLGPATGIAMKPRPVAPVVAVELLALVNEFTAAEKLYHAHVGQELSDLATNEERDTREAASARLLERLDAISEVLHERIEGIVGALPAAVVLPDGGICVALEAAGGDGAAHAPLLLLKNSRIRTLG
jgi:hypothetical protein